jgi:hypothetical protein
LPKCTLKIHRSLPPLEGLIIIPNVATATDRLRHKDTKQPAFIPKIKKYFTPKITIDI